MELQEIIQKKDELQKDITDKLRLFCKETGLDITGISLYMENFLIADTNASISVVKVNINL